MSFSLWPRLAVACRKDPDPNPAAPGLDPEACWRNPRRLGSRKWETAPRPVRFQWLENLWKEQAAKYRNEKETVLLGKEEQKDRTMVQLEGCWAHAHAQRGHPPKHAEIGGRNKSFHPMRPSPPRCGIASCIKPLGLNSRVSRCQRPSRQSRVQEELLRRGGREAQGRGTVVGKKPPPNGAPGATLRTATLRVGRSVRSGATPIGDRFLVHDSTLAGPSSGKATISGLIGEVLQSI